MSDDKLLETLVALERGALDLWARGDTLGYATHLADDATYFDHATRERLQGIEAIRAHVAAFHGKFSFPRHEIINAAAHRDGNFAVLAFNWEPYGADGQPVMRWNATSVYSRVDGAWRIRHTHWSTTVKG